MFTFEFPHLLNLIASVQFDTIYHEHFSYLSLLAVERVFTRHGLRVFDVAEMPTHGGSLRVFVCHTDSARQAEPAVSALRDKEKAAQIDRAAGYAGFAPRVEKVRRELMAFLESAAADKRKVAAYGAAAKGNTLLNYCGIGRERIAFVADRNPTKQDRLLPGSRIPVRRPETIFELKPDYVLILPWNLKDEIARDLSAIREWGGKFVTAIPSVLVD